MMAGNPNWWSINGMHPQSHHQLSSSSSTSSSSPHEIVYGPNSSNPSPSDHNHHQDFPVRSWSQLLLGGLAGGEEERFGASLFQQQKKLENWEDQVLNLNPESNFSRIGADVKQEISNNAQSSPHELYAHHHHHHHHHMNHDQMIQHDERHHSSVNFWPIPPQHNHQLAHAMPISSPTSCITTLSNNNFLNFSGAKPITAQGKNNNHQEQSSHECNSTGSGGVAKKARVQQSSAQPALKVRKEKLGDRITALHQLVSPFGKTDTASVLSEAIGYIRFLQGQIEALSSPYMRNASGSTVLHQHSVQERNCLFPEEPGQFLNDMAMDGRGASKQESQSRGDIDLRSRGLCLVPISCTQHVGNDNGADYWAPAALGGGF